MKKKLRFVTMAIVMVIMSFDTSAQNDLIHRQSIQEKQAFLISEEIVGLTRKPQSVTHFDSSYNYLYVPVTNTWEATARTIDIQYDKDDNIIHQLDQEKGATGFENVLRTDYSYEKIYNKTRLKTRRNQYWDGSSWKNLNLSTYEYDLITNKLVTIFIQENECHCGQWNNTRKYAYTYDCNGNLIQDEGSLWDDGVYRQSFRTLYSYDVHNRLKERTYQVLEFHLTYWQSLLRSLFSYNQQGSKEVELMEDWSNNTWVQHEKAKRRYDENHHLVKEDYFFPEDSGWIKKTVVVNKYTDEGLLKTTTATNVSNGEITFGIRTRFFYHSGSSCTREAVSSINVLSEQTNALSVYPNPSTGNFTVRFDNQPLINVEVYNGLGEKILEQHSGDVDLNKVNKGFYFIRVYDGNKVYQEKVLIQ